MTLSRLTPKELEKHALKMKQGSTLELVVRDIEERRCSGRAQILHFSERERLQRALKALALLWGVAVVAILFPLVHFVLVPALFLAGCIVPFFRYKVTSILLAGEVTCPECKRTQVLESGPNSWPLQSLCGDCGNRFEIMPAQ